MAAERARYRFFGTTADQGLRVSAPDLDSLFAAAGEAVFSAIADRRTVRASRERRVELSADGLEPLLVAWLNEIIYIFDTERLLGRRCSVRVTAGGKSLRAVISGEPYDPSRHRIATMFKAATWHKLAVRRSGDGWRATVVLDV